MSGSPVEIERVWLLSDLPELPSTAECLRIRQGYLSPGDPGDTMPADPDHPPTTGRIRAIEGSDGATTFIHTLKHGQGRVRQERERPLSARAFEAAWPATSGRRLTKTRWRVPVEEWTWEIDHFDRLDMVLAEVELRHPGEVVTIPRWLERHVVREVTEDPAFRNAELAARLGLLDEK
ncbi:MAG: hypothetical protein MK085_01940 [Phycisphaerales bacterium]|nr:hypothetical protein [Phycisphaerales bacterium]